MINNPLRRTAAVAISIVALLGCGDNGLPDLRPVEGSVTLGDQPITQGSVAFWADGTGADPAYSPTGAIDETGRYKLYIGDHPGCPAGQYRVVVFANAPVVSNQGGNAGLPKSIIDRRYNDRQSTPLRVGVREDAPAGTYDLRIEP